MLDSGNVRSQTQNRADDGNRDRVISGMPNTLARKWIPLPKETQWLTCGGGVLRARRAWSLRRLINADCNCGRGGERKAFPPGLLTSQMEKP
jgi:hypothetical protein